MLDGVANLQLSDQAGPPAECRSVSTQGGRHGTR